jgi:DNA-binding NarL/FixJ family response regulator
MGMDAERILLCIDDGARRRLFAAALAPSSDLEVVGAGAADESGVRAAAARQPDVILVEAARPGLEGAKLVGRLRAVAPAAAVLAVALQDDRPRTVIARGLVADRYVDPDVATAGLLDVLLEFVRDRRAGRIAS